MPGLSHRWLSNVRNDVVGGLVSAAVAIPLAMGYGMFAFVSLGDQYLANGALAGLITACAAGIVNVALGDRTASVYAPRVTSTFFIGFLLYNIIHGDSATAGSGDLALTLAIIFSIICLSGAFQLLFGLVRLGTLMKYIPHPVMAGFQNAAAVLLFLVQLGNVFGLDRSTPFVQALQEPGDARPLSIAVAAIVFVTMWNSRRMFARIPPLVVGLLVGTVAYYLLVFAGFSQQLGPVIGSASPAALGLSLPTGFPALLHRADFRAILPTIVGGAFALALIASIDALLCAKLLTAPGDPRINGDRLLVRLGAGNVISSCFGGITSGLNLGPSLANRAFGGRTPLSVLVNAAAIVVAGVALFPVVAQLPRAVLSAAIMVIAVQHIDPWTIRTIRRIASGSTDFRPRITLELFVVLLVATLSVTVDIVLAVFLGLAIAVILFLLRMSRSIIRRMYRCENIRSRKSRSLAEMEALERLGGRILVMELQGALFFGTAERLGNEISAQRVQEADIVILDLRRITEIDSTGSLILQEINAHLRSNRTELLMAVAQPSDSAELLADSGVMDMLRTDRIFPDVDRAIEWAEDALLAADSQDGSGDTEIRAERLSTFRGFTPADFAAILPLLERKVYAAGDTVFAEGDAGSELFIVAKGSAVALLRRADGGYVRLVKLAPSTVFGELAMLDQGTRSASVMTDEELVCQVLSAEDFALLAAHAPATAILLLSNLGRELSRKLRVTNRTIQQLEE